MFAASRRLKPAAPCSIHDSTSLRWSRLPNDQVTSKDASRGLPFGRCLSSKLRSALYLFVQECVLSHRRP